MNETAAIAALRQTLEDLRLTRTERSALGEALGVDGLSEAERRALRAQAFEVARDELSHPDARAVVTWLEEIGKVLATPMASKVADCRFSPGHACRQRIGELIDDARRSLDVCVFTITDDLLADALVDAQRRGVRVRVISDDDKATDRGSDLGKLRSAGISSVVDHDEAHMHHKFAIADRALLLSGSYNWTRSAFLENRENILVTDDGRLVAGYLAEFERLWKEFGGR